MSPKTHVTLCTALGCLAMAGDAFQRATRGEIDVSKAALPLMALAMLLVVSGRALSEFNELERLRNEKRLG